MLDRERTSCGGCFREQTAVPASRISSLSYIYSGVAMLKSFSDLDVTEMSLISEPDVMGTLGIPVEVDRSTSLILGLLSCAIMHWKL